MITSICFCLAGLCLAYYFAVLVMSGPNTSFSWFWVLLAVLPAGFGWLYGWRRELLRSMPGFVKVLLAAAALAGVVIFGIFFGKILQGMRSSAPSGAAYMVVLGAKVKHGRPSRALLLRLESALAYAEENPETVLILSGGQGPDEALSEAVCMQEWLLSNGLEKSRLVLEDRSTSTRENLVFSDRMTGCKEGPVLVVTNDFHVYRAVQLARKLGYREVYGLAAPTRPAVMFLHYAVREVFASVKEILAGSMSL